MTRARRLIDRIGAQEAEQLSRPFLAPCLRGARVRVRIAGMVREFVPHPGDFEGWGVFQAKDERTVELLREPEASELAAYLEKLPRLRAWLSRRLERRSWLAVAANRSDARQRFGLDAPVVVRLCHGRGQFDRIIARHDGASWWFDEEDRRADPVLSAGLREDTASSTSEMPTRKGITPELALAYRLATSPDPFARNVPVTDERRLGEALGQAGGHLREYRDHGEFWWVEWSGPDGRVHQSAIAKTDLTVITAGICLDGMDQDFDLQSLVGVVDGAEDWAY